MAVESQRKVPAWLIRGGGFLLDAGLHSYGQILFSRSRVVAVLLLGATAVSPRLFVFGLGAVLTAIATAILLRYEQEQIRAGLFGINALLVGLAGAATFAPEPKAIGLLFVAVIGSVLVTAALHSALGLTFNLPALSLPFVFVFYLLIGAAPILGVEAAPAQQVSAIPPALPEPLILYLRSLGAIFFQPRVEAGAVILLALLFYSRVGLLLSLVGFGVAYLLGIHLLGLSDGSLPVLLGFNFILVAVALGGVWFVPSVSSFLLAAASAALCGLIALGTLPILVTAGVPLLILPFNVTVILLLYAMRQRVADLRPKSVDFLLGTPEENINYFRTRLARFGASYFVRFSAPFLGRWTCTQGVDGDQTHKGQWRHAFDFELAGNDGQMFQGKGKLITDYHCYRLPVVAPAAGTVVKVTDGVADNPVGEINVDENWGNAVVIYHGPCVYTMVCHLAPGSIKVQEGQIVERGDALAMCGNSGRSPVPHLHFQIQATARLGAPTLVAELHDVVLENDQPSLRATCVPAKGDVVRNINGDNEIAQTLHFAHDQTLSYRVQEKGATWQERISPEVDLYGNSLLRSDRGRAVLYYEKKDALFTVFDVLGSGSSILQLVQAALPRVPFEAAEGLVWKDYVPLRRYVTGPIRWLFDIVSPFVSVRGIEMSYELSRFENKVVIQGCSVETNGDSPSSLETRAEFEKGKGLVAVEVTRHGKKARAELVEERADQT